MYVAHTLLLPWIDFVFPVKLFDNHEHLNSLTFFLLLYSAVVPLGLVKSSETYVFQNSMSNWAKFSEIFMGYRCCFLRFPSLSFSDFLAFSLALLSDSGALACRRAPRAGIASSGICDVVDCVVGPRWQQARVFGWQFRCVQIGGSGHCFLVLECWKAKARF